MIKLLKQLFNIKFYVLFIIVQCGIALLYVNTISLAVDNYFSAKELDQYKADLQNIAIYGEITDYNTYNKIIDELKDNDVEVYIFSMEQDVDENNNYFYKIGISESYANKLVDLDMIDLTNTGGTLVSNNGQGERFGKCDKVKIGFEIFECDKAVINVIEDEKLNTWFVDFFDTMYSSGIAVTHLFEYDGDLYTLVSNILAANGIDSTFEVLDGDDSSLMQQKTADFLVSQERQNIISIVIICILEIILVAYHYMISKYRTIAILSLLGFSRIKILLSLLLIHITMLIPVYFILLYNEIKVMNLYLLIDLIFLFLTITVMFVVLQRKFELKARERM